LIDVRGDVAWYLDHPDAFGRVYLVSRAYAAAWGALGVAVVWMIARRLSGRRAAILASLLFTMLPIVVCMSHEGKPHLPGAVLMLLAAWLAMRYVSSGRPADWLGMSVACGAAFGMVLSSLPIFVLVPLAEWLRRRGGEGGTPSWNGAIRRVVFGTCFGFVVYFLTNPYVLINLFGNRDVLRSNFGNSLAMYEVSRLGEGFLRVLELTDQGASWPVLLLGVAAAALAVARRRRDVMPLLVPAGLVFLQFVLLGAGKPAEYGRFGVFVDSVLAIAAACLLVGGMHPSGSDAAPPGRRQRRVRLLRYALVAGVVGWVGHGGGRCLGDFLAETGSADLSTRTVTSRLIEDVPAIGVLAEPAPYSCPPLAFADRTVRLYASLDDWLDDPTPVLVTAHDGPSWTGPRLPEPADAQWMDLVPSVGSPISWANKTFRLYYANEERAAAESTGGP
jgi:hypothetical protein